MQTIDIKNLKLRLGTQPKVFFLVDTREPEEYNDGHLPGAMLIPWHMIDEKIKGIKKETEIILYCRTGARASRAADILENIGYKNVLLFKEGWEGWEEIHGK